MFVNGTFIGGGTSKNRHLSGVEVLGGRVDLPIPPFLRLFFVKTYLLITAPDSGLFVFRGQAPRPGPGGLARPLLL